MRVPSHPTLIRRMIDSRLRPRRLQAGAGGQPVAGAQALRAAVLLLPPRRRCPPAWHVSFKEDGKTRTVYVPKDLLDDVQSWAEEHQRLKNLLGEINQLTLALIRTHSQHSKRKKGRP